MPAETDRDYDIRDLRARIVVLEAIQNQVLVATARLSGAPEAFLQGLMAAAEKSLNEALRTADDASRQTASDAVASFRDRSMRLIAALTPGQIRQ